MPSIFSFRVRTAVCFLILAASLLGKDPEWTRLESDGLEVFTTAGVKRGQQAVRQFQQVRGVFSQIMGKAADNRLPIRIIVFSSRSQYEPYAPHKQTAAFYFGTRNRDYIVMSTADPDAFQIAVHEYTHLLLKDAKPPLWLNEGLAELYSTMREYKGKIAIGEPIAHHYRFLDDSRGTIPVEQILSVTHESKEYNDTNRRGSFYAQSWGLTHMLNFGETYRAQFPKFAETLERGKPGVEALREVYGKTPKDVEKDFSEYLRAFGFRFAVFDVKLDKSAEAAESRAADEFEAGLVLADLKGLTKRGAEAAAGYLALKDKFPDKAEVYEGLGYIYWREGDLDKTKEHFGRAVQLGSMSSEILRQHAFFRQRDGAPEQEILQTLERAALLEPANRDLQLQVAYQASGAKEYLKAWRFLARVKVVEPDQAFHYFRTLAYVAEQLKKKDEAVNAAQKALKSAQTPTEREHATQLLAWVSHDGKSRLAAPAVRRSEVLVSPEGAAEAEAQAALDKATVHRTGVFTHLQCKGLLARLHLVSNGEEIRLLIRESEKVKVWRRAGEGVVDLSCGPQPETKMDVGFVPRQDEAEGTAGDVVSIEFQ